MNVLYDRDANPRVLAGKTIAVIGYGSQGRAHARNLHDSGCDVIVGLRPNSSSAQHVRADGLRHASVEEATQGADIVMVLVPDEEQPALYLRAMHEHLRPNVYLAFAHGFGIHFGTVVPPKTANVFMVAPKSPGRLVRSEYEAGRGVPCLIAVHQDPAGNTREVALAYASAIGGGRAGILETTFKDETETDLFGEQAVLCGGVSELVTAGFETLVESGYEPEMAYFECLHELKLIVDLMYRGGLAYMRHSISDTAEWGDYVAGPRIVTAETKKAMKKLLEEIQDGSFAKKFIEENETGRHQFARIRQEEAAHGIEKVGAELRKAMPFLDPVKVVDGAVVKA
ncbi:MAG: ketol-acid reductoisomerase [Vulcanimicrobiaceae bacterium]